MEQNANLDYLLSRQIEENEKSAVPISEEPDQKKVCVPDGCTKVAQQYADIITSVSMKSKSIVGKIETECCGDPVVYCEKSKCDNVCNITIKQKVCVKIPISYKINVCIEEDGRIDCDCD